MKCENIYTEGISRFYDDIVNAYYYDYSSLVCSLKNLFGEKRNLLEIGVGTGLAAEKLIKLGYYVTGVDFSEEMLKISSGRLGKRAELHCSDIKDFKSNKKFDAAFSVGGAWYITKKMEGGYTLLSYILSDEDNIKALENISNLLTENGLLAVSIHERHKNSPELPIGKGFYYSHTVNQKKQFVIKNYCVKKGNQIVANQKCTFREFNKEEINTVLKKNGFSDIQITDNGSFAYIKKQGLGNCNRVGNNLPIEYQEPLISQ